MPQRPDKIQYYLNIAREVSRRATCYRAHMGCIVVRDDQIIATGYNGAPRKTKDCYERGNCLRIEMKIPRGQRYEICRSVHGEQNAIINAARAGVSLFGADMYMYGTRMPGERPMDALPCFFCKREIINAGIKNFVGLMSNGRPQVFTIKDWVEDWRHGDIIDDQFQYGTNKKSGEEKPATQ